MSPYVARDPTSTPVRAEIAGLASVIARSDLEHPCHLHIHYTEQVLA